ncbi:MAG: Mur ligase family protein [Planctomycetota bacterium]
MPTLSCQPAAISLRGLFPQARFIGGRDIRVASCKAEAEQCEPGDLFIAITAADADGHEDVEEALRRGASAVLSERLLPVSVPTCVVRDTRAAHGELCQALAGHPTEQMKTVGVTGSLGKTITSELLASILRAAQQRRGLMNSLIIDDGEMVMPSDLEAPSAPELADHLARMLHGRCSHAIVEVSQEALTDYRTAGMTFDAAVLTNVLRDPSLQGGSALTMREIQSRLFAQLKPTGFAVINADDPVSEFYLRTLKIPVLTYSLRNSAEVTATVLERSSSEQTFMLHAGADSIAIRSSMIGDHHVYNCLAAAAVALVWNIDLPTIARGLERLEHVAGRLEQIQCGQPFSVYVDQARTPAALTASLRAIRQTVSGRVICVYGAEGERRQEARAQLGRVVERGAHLEVITSDNPRGEEPLAIAHDILDGYGRPARPLVRPDRQAAIHWALQQARPGDAVLIAGKGGATCQEIGSRRMPWDDRDIARSWLYAHPEAGNLYPPGYAPLRIFG